jgi:DegV family protein with EDD domain
MPVAVVTDSTASLTSAVAEAEGVAVVPLQVVVDGTAYAEGVDVTPSDVAAALRAHRSVTTSRPGPQLFLDAYTKAAERGADAVVSLHISAALSGTCESAILAARESPIPVEVVDSRTMGMGLGFVVLDGARRARRGAGMEDLAAAARRRAAGTSAYFYVATLEHLRRGGRIGAASALLGSALAIRPLLVLDEGVIAPLEKVRTSGRAMARLEELALRAAARAAGPVEVAVQHLDAADRAERLAQQLQHSMPGAGEVVVAEVGAVVGAHVGPGLVAVVVSPLQDGVFGDR